jgi:hypothetical protein
MNIDFIKNYKPEELTADGIPTIQTQLREIEEKDAEQLEKYYKDDKERYNREMKQRVKCLALKKMNKNVFTNTFDLNIYDREKLQELMWEYNDYEHSDIIKQFNNLMTIEAFDNPNFDYTKVPIYEWRK